MSESTSPTTPAAGAAPAEQSVSMAPVPAAPPTPARPARPARRSANRLLLINGAGLLVLLVVGLGLYYLWHQSYYFYKTNDAQVSAPTAQVAPLVPGAIQSVALAQGATVRAGETIATLRGQGGASRVVSPLNGTIVQEGATLGEVLGSGQPLAQVADLSAVYITAYVEENHIADVHTGQGVDVKLDAVSDVALHGTVTRIQPVAASALSAVPTTDYASGNFTKVTQRVPVQIALDGTEGHTLYPGTSAEVTVHIHD